MRTAAAPGDFARGDLVVVNGGKWDGELARVTSIGPGGFNVRTLASKDRVGLDYGAHVVTTSSPALIKRIKDRLDVFPKTAVRIAGLIDGSIDPMEYESAADHYRRCFYDPGREILALYAINQILDANGIEGVEDQETGQEGVSYVNMGDPYVATVLYFSGRKNPWMICGWGDARIPAHWR